MSRKLKVFIENIVQLHVKYLNDKTVVQNLQYPQLVINEDILNIFYRFQTASEGRLEQKLIAERINEIINNAEGSFKKISIHGEELLIYGFLEKLYNITNQNEWKCYFNQLVEFYLEKISSKCFDLPKQHFEKLVKCFVPYIKLKHVVKNFQNTVSPSKTLLSQVFECIRYPNFSREECYQVVFNNIQTNDYEFIGFEVNPLVIGIGFLGEHFNLKITIKMKDVVKELYFFAKFIPNNNKICETIALNAFKKEEFIYRKFIPILKKHGYDELSKFAPKCFLTKTNDVIVLEDLYPLGFTSSDIKVPVTPEWMIMVAKQMGRFHACSMVLDKRFSLESNLKMYTGDVFSEYLLETNFDKDNPTCFFMYFGGLLISDYFAEKLCDICRKLPLEEFKKKARIEVEQAFVNVKRSKNFYNVICHGDLWGGNVLTNSSMDCVFIDYQIIRYCPPAVDLLFTIYINSTKELRLQYLNEILNIYYNTLKESLMLYNIDINDFFTEEKFLESVDYFKPTAVVQSLIYLQMMLCPKDFIDVLRKDEEKANRFYTEERRDVYEAAWSSQPFRTRIRSLMEELYEICEQR